MTWETCMILVPREISAYFLDLKTAVDMESTSFRLTDTKTSDKSEQSFSA
jgi:hypothetical protein